MTKPEKYSGLIFEETSIERCIFSRQHPYGIYILDFYCFEANLAVEVDGKIHLNKVEYDKERQATLNQSGLKVIRFDNEDIEMHLDWVLNEIEKYLI